MEIDRYFSSEEPGTSTLTAVTSGRPRAETPALTKAALVEMLFAQVGLNRSQARAMVEAFFEVMRDTLESGENIKLAGFGSFRLRDKVPRPGRNPRTRSAFVIEARRVVTFHATPTLKQMVHLAANEFHTQQKRDRGGVNRIK